MHKVHELQGIEHEVPWDMKNSYINAFFLFILFCHLTLTKNIVGVFSAFHIRDIRHVHLIYNIFIIRSGMFGRMQPLLAYLPVKNVVWYRVELDTKNTLIQTLGDLKSLNENSWEQQAEGRDVDCLKFQ